MSEMQQQTQTSELFYLKWSNFQMSVSSEFKKIQEAADLVDITFSCEGKQFGAHKLVLFACSPYFKEILKKNPCSHPVFFINGFKSDVLRAILDFMYLGEVHINNEDLVDFIEMAEQFKIRGVTKEQTESSARRHDIAMEKLRKTNKRIRLDEMVETTSGDSIIEPKSEITDYGETASAVGTYGNATVEYNTQHKVSDTHPYDDAGPSSVPSQTDQWMDDKHFMTSTSNTSAPSSNDATATTDSQQDPNRCKTKNYKALEPCSCPLCARVYSNVSNLRQHMRLIHNPTSVCCPLCQKSFTSDLYLKRHFMSMHGGSQIPQMNQTTTATQQQAGQQQQPTAAGQQHTVDGGAKHVTQPSSFHIYGKREYTDLQTTATNANPNLDGSKQQQQQQQQQMTHNQPWTTYDAKVE